MKKFSVVLIVTTMIFSLIYPGVSLAQTSTLIGPETKLVETFVIDIIETNEDGLLETIGYKEVNSDTEVTMDENKISTKISVIEDHYDLNGQYLKTIIKSEEFINDFETGKALAKSQDRELKGKPLTMLTSNLNDKLEKNELTVDEKRNVSSLIDRQVKLLPKSEFIEVEGFTHEQLNEIKKIANEAMALYKNQEQDYTIQTVQRAGAYDNYYNIDTYNNNYRLQTIGNAKNVYLVWEGKTNASTRTATNVNIFADYIDNYEDYIIRHMEGASFWEVSSWWVNVVSFVGWVVGYAAGPAGWASIVATYIGAFSLFYSITSSAYATYERLQYSGKAAQYLEGARTMMVWGQNYFDNAKFSTTTGF